MAQLDITEKTKINLAVLRALGFTLAKSGTGNTYYSLNGHLVGIYSAHRRTNYLLMLPCMLTTSPNRVGALMLAANTTLAAQLAPQA